VTLPSIQDLARDWRLTWSPMRAGGLLLLAAYDEDEAVAIVSRLAGIEAGVAGVEWRRRAAVFNDAVVTELRRFFSEAHLAEGTYAIPNYYGPQAPNGCILLDSTSDGRNVIAVPETPEIAVAFTGAHLALIRAANVATWESLIAPIDPLAPYGASASHYADMARALGETFAPDSAPRYDRLHGEMLFATHAFLIHGATNV